MKVNFNQKLNNRKYQNDIINIFSFALKQTKLQDAISVNIVDVSPEEIKMLNKTYRNVDSVTDVLSFPMLDSIKDIENEPDYKLGECNIGDIYINPQRAKSQSQLYNHSYKREYCFLALHGFLHLIGYDHIEKNDEKIMMDLQEKILLKAEIKRG